LQMVDVPTRYAVAVELLEYYTEEIEEGWKSLFFFLFKIVESTEI
jgi:hypothetical protein